jgi:hypothetical protein
MDQSNVSTPAATPPAEGLVGAGEPLDDDEIEAAIPVGDNIAPKRPPAR